MGCFYETCDLSNLTVSDMDPEEVRIMVLKKTHDFMPERASYPFQGWKVVLPPTKISFGAYGVTSEVTILDNQEEFDSIMAQIIKDWEGHPYMDHIKRHYPELPKDVKEWTPSNYLKFIDETASYMDNQLDKELNPNSLGVKDTSVGGLYIHVVREDVWQSLVAPLRESVLKFDKNVYGYTQEQFEFAELRCKLIGTYVFRTYDISKESMINLLCLNYLLHRIHKTVQTSCARGTQRENYKDIINFNNEVTKIAKKGLAAQKKKYKEWGMSKRDIEELEMVD